MILANCGGDFPPQTIERSRLILLKTQKMKERRLGQEHRCGAFRRPSGVRVRILFWNGSNERVLVCRVFGGRSEPLSP